MPEASSQTLIENSEEAPLVRSILSKAALVFAIILSTLALLIHIALIMGAVDFFQSNGSELLLSMIMPEYVKSPSTAPVLPEGELMESEDPEKVDESFPHFLERDLSANAENGFSLSNETTYTPDLHLLSNADRKTMTADETDLLFNEKAPKVLIYHTHATEGYSDSFGTSFRTVDTEKNTVAIGDTVTEVLEAAGIEVLHLRELFDEESWSDSYENSHRAVTAALSKYPSIQYVFDIHRDCLGNEEEGYIKTVTQFTDKKVAQLMIVCGTDEGGSSHTSWRDNLSFALCLQKEIWQTHKTLMRPIYLRRASFYQDTTPASLLIECGTCANTLTEARRGAVLFAVSLADYILGGDCGLSAEELINTLCP